MQVYFYPQRDTWRRIGFSATQLQSILERIAAGTETADLVVAVHLVRCTAWSGGTAYVRQWHHPAAFYARRGKWRLREEWDLPADLPPRFKLIRLLLADDRAPYPLTIQDRYGWQHRFGTFGDQLAFFFAHELHHFRRFHLGLHQGEGEHGANLYAVERCRELGFEVASLRLQRRPPKKKAHSGPTFWQVLNPADFLPAAQASLLWRRGGAILGLAVRLRCRDRGQYIAGKLRHFEQLMQTPPGARLWITFDPQRRYQHAPVRLVRTLRRPSLRVLIETGDGKQWRWPMSWLTDEPPVP